MRSAVVVVALLLAGCPRPAAVGGACEGDGDCGLGQFCDTAKKQCLCRDDSACDATETCNSVGRCQGKNGCVSNDDCADEGGTRQICDTTTSTCTALSAAVGCFLSSHCPYGSYCAGNQCVPGCQTNGDCVIGQPCLDGQCDPRAGTCNDNSFCNYGEICNLDNNTCRAHRQMDTLCQECEPRLCLDNSDCPSGIPCVGASFTSLGECEVCPGGGACLIDTTIPPDSCTQDSQCTQYPGAHCSKNQCFQDTDCPSGTCNGGDPIFGTLGTCTGGNCGAYFCGTDACDDATDPCPRGYGCSQLIIVDPNRSCSNDSQCGGNTACSAGGENNVAGFCSCASDADCLSAQSGATCVNPGPFGYCLQGTTCGPQSGRTCRDLR